MNSWLLIWIPTYTGTRKSWVIQKSPDFRHTYNHRYASAMRASVYLKGLSTMGSALRSRLYSSSHTSDYRTGLPQGGTPLSPLDYLR